MTIVDGESRAVVLDYGPSIIHVRRIFGPDIQTAGDEQVTVTAGGRFHPGTWRARRRCSESQIHALALPGFEAFIAPRGFDGGLRRCDEGWPMTGAASLLHAMTPRFIAEGDPPTPALLLHFDAWQPCTTVSGMRFRFRDVERHYDESRDAREHPLLVTFTHVELLEVFFVDDVDLAELEILADWLDEQGVEQGPPEILRAIGRHFRGDRSLYEPS